MSAVDDAVECVRKDATRASELQSQANQALNDRVGELDEKLFALDKELLRLKLALPSAVAAQMGTPFGDHQSKFTVNGKGCVELPTGGMVLQHKLQELSMEIAAV